MIHHVLKATCETVHLGGFSPNLLPVLDVRSGDHITVETYTGFYVADQAPPAFVPPGLAEICHQLRDDRKVSSGPHLLTGPIAIEGAEPGDVLEIRLEQIVPSVAIGFNAIRSGWGALPDRFNQPRVRFIPLDLERYQAEFPPHSGIQIPLQPFFGILGVATHEIRSSVPPGDYGGNLDNPFLQAGSRLFLPVYVPGALFSIGDGHSAQGNGEVNVMAIETSMNGTIQLILHKASTPIAPSVSDQWAGDPLRLVYRSLPLPIAETPTDWITMGFGPTLDLAFQQALERMIAFLEMGMGLGAEDAYVLCSLAVHFQITQVVNQPQKGVHAHLPKAILPRAILGGSL